MHRRGILSAAGAIAAYPRILGAQETGAVTQLQWMKTLVRELGLTDKGEKELTTSQMIERLDLPGYSDLSADAITLRSPTVKEEKLVLAGGASERWLKSGKQSATIVFRVRVQRPSRHLVLFRTRGGPHLVSFGSQETRAIDRPADDTSNGVQSVTLKEGWQEIAVSLSPEGAIERILLHPEAAAPIAPVGGWKPEQALTYGAKASTLVRLGGWEDELPLAEGGPRPLVITGGYDHQGRSLRRIRLEEPGVYTLAARISGTPPTAIMLDDRLLFPRPGITGLRTATQAGSLVTLGTLYLDELDHDLSFHGSGGAIHELLRLKRVASTDRYLQVARAHGFEASGADATASHTAVVNAAALGRNAGSLRAWLVGPIDAPKKHATAAKEIPVPPRRPSPISPILPGDPLP